MSTLSTPLVLVLLVLLLHPPPAPADISSQYNNYFDADNVCGMSPLNKRANSSLLPVGRSEPYVINGNDAHLGEWPFVVLVKLNLTRCTGVIVSSGVVVTAGHCIRSFDIRFWDSGIKTEVPRYAVAYVSVGELLLTEEGYSRSYDISHFQEGAYYEDRHFRQAEPDFGRLWTAMPIEYNDYVQYVCITSDPYEIYTLARGPLYFIGNGLIQEEPDRTEPTKTQWMRMKMGDPYFWDRMDGYGEKDSEMYFTTLDKSYRMVCKGDSGGPLVALDRNLRWSLVGIASKKWHTCTPYPQPVNNSFVLMANILGIFDKKWYELIDATRGTDFVWD